HYVSYYSPFTHPSPLFTLFFFHDTPPTDIYTLSLHDALPIYPRAQLSLCLDQRATTPIPVPLLFITAELLIGPEGGLDPTELERSEEHTSELQSLADLACRLLLEKKKKQNHTYSYLLTTPPSL